jgi:outer membrane protein assembly factor BamB
VTRLLGGLFILAGLAGVARAADWPHWRGPNRDDITSDPSGWDGSKWLADGEVWRTNVGLGCGSPLVVDGRLYTTGWNGGRDTLFCIDTATGRTLWTQSRPAPRYGRHATGDQGIYAGPTATPEYDPATHWLYTLGGDGDLVCWDTRADGKLVWHVNLYERHGVTQRPNVGNRSNMLRDYGYTTSPLVHEDWLLVEVGARTGTLVALDKRTGRQAWASRCADEAGHSGGPVPMTVEGVPCVALLTLRKLVVVRLDEGRAGETVAEFPWTTDFGNNIPTPAVHESSVLVTSAYNQYAMGRVDVTLDGAKLVWRRDNPSGVCSPVVHEGRVYWAWRGDHCVDFATGQELWIRGNVGEAGSCLITGDDRLVVLADNGDLMLVETANRSPDKFRTLAQRRGILRTDAWPHVVLADGRLYCKDRAGNLVCLAVGRR